MENTSARDRFLAQLGSPDQILSLFDVVPGVSFFMKNRRGRFIALNRRGCEYCGVANESEAIGKTDHDFFPKRRADEYRIDDLAVMRTGVPILNRIESAPESAGSPRLVMTSKIPIRNPAGKVIGIAGFSRQVDQIEQPSANVAAFAEVIEYVHQHYDEPLTTKTLAGMAGLSVSQFERRFRRAFGNSVRKYLLRVRIENGARLLRESNETVSNIAQQCGFYDHAHFSRAFRQVMKQTPTQYRCHD